LALLAVAFFQVFVSSKSAYAFGSKSFASNWFRFSKSASRFLGKVLASKRFHFAKSVFSGLRSFWQSQAFKIGFKVLAKVSASLVRAFLPGSFFLAK